MQRLDGMKGSARLADLQDFFTQIFYKMESDNKRMFDALRKIQSQNMTEIQIKEIVDEALNDTVEARLVGSTTNSPIGCQHWFNTILGHLAHIGDFMQERELTQEQRENWGKQLSDEARILIANYDKIPFHY